MEEKGKNILLGGLFLASMLLFASIVVSCKTNLVFSDPGGFKIEHNRPAPEVKVHQTTEVKFWLKEDTPLIDNVYTIKLYISSGKGVAYLGKSFNEMKPNEVYILHLEPDGSFVFNYTPLVVGHHDLEFTIVGTSYPDQKKVIPLKFNVV